MGVEGTRRTPNDVVALAQQVYNLNTHMTQRLLAVAEQQSELTKRLQAVVESQTQLENRVVAFMRQHTGHSRRPRGGGTFGGRDAPHGRWVNAAVRTGNTVGSQNTTTAASSNSPLDHQHVTASPPRGAVLGDFTSDGVPRTFSVLSMPHPPDMASSGTHAGVTSSTAGQAVPVETGGVPQPRLAPHASGHTLVPSQSGIDWDALL